MCNLSALRLYLIIAIAPPLNDVVFALRVEVVTAKRYISVLIAHRQKNPNSNFADADEVGAKSMDNGVALVDVILHLSVTK